MCEYSFIIPCQVQNGIQFYFIQTHCENFTVKVKQNEFTENEEIKRNNNNRCKFYNKNLKVFNSYALQH